MNSVSIRWDPFLLNVRYCEILISPSFCVGNFNFKFVIVVVVVSLFLNWFCFRKSRGWGERESVREMFIKFLFLNFARILSTTKQVSVSENLRTNRNKSEKLFLEFQSSWRWRWQRQQNTTKHNKTQQIITISFYFSFLFCLFSFDFLFEKFFFLFFISKLFQNRICWISLEKLSISCFEKIKTKLRKATKNSCKFKFEIFEKILNPLQMM